MSGAPEGHGPGFWVGLVIGGAVMTFGVVGLLDNANAVNPFAFATWFVGADLAHDLLLAPLVCLVGALLVRAVRMPWRVPVQGGLVASAIVLAVAWAPLRGYGRTAVPDNPTVLPLDYSTAVLTVLAAVWAAVATWLALTAWARRRRAPARSAAPQHALPRP